MNHEQPLDTATKPYPLGRFPWPPAEHDSILGAFADTWRGSALEPRRFFAALPPHRSIGPALLYYLPLGIAVAGAGLFWRLIGGGLGDMGPLSDLGIEGSSMSPLIEFLTSPLVLLLSLFVSAGVTHLMLKMIGAPRRDVGTTVRVFAYAYSPQILGVIPWLGQVVGGVWMVVLAIIGLREAHRTTTMKAALAVLIPLAIALFFIFAAMLILATTSVLMG